MLLLLDRLSSIFVGHYLESQTVIYAAAAAAGCCYKIAANFAQTMLLLLQTIGSLY